MVTKNIKKEDLKVDLNSISNNSNSVVEAPVIQPNSFINGDCMEFMRTCPPNFFDLAIVDPPYGIGNFQQSDGNHNPVGWNDKIPDPKYFEELKRVSKNQIIWGANYYNCFNNNGGAIIWDKLNVHPSMSRCEIASCTLQKRITYFAYEWHGYVVKRVEPDSFHPCQKPVALYRWLIKKYAKPGNLILDTHVGSASSLVACIELGYDYVGFEIDEKYYTMAKSRLGRATRKYELFEAV